MKTNVLILAGLLFFIAAVFPGCADDECTDCTDLTFLFTHKVGSELLGLNSVEYTNTAGNDYSVITLKYFVSDFILHKTDGEMILIDDEHYVDVDDESTQTFTPNVDIPLADFEKITFIFGLNQEKNITGAYTNPPENAMEWPVPMGGGYHYMKLEGKHDSSGVIKNYQAHSGALMGTQYYVDVDLPNSSFSTQMGVMTIEIAMDINKWWESPNVLDLNEVTGIMGNPFMQLNLHENGSNVFSIVSIK